MPKTLNIAVIGVGTQAQAVHLPVLRRRWDRFAVTALVDHSERRRRESAEVWGVAEEQRFASVADLVAAVRAKQVSLDGALLSTDGLHVEDLLALIRRGIPVLVEPPLGFSADEVARIADLERMTGRRLVMMAYPQQYDESVQRVPDLVARKDVRLLEHEVLMPASQPLFGAAHVTTASYDLPSEKRAERRSALQSAVVEGAGPSATQRDRDLYVKGLLTGVAHQLAVLEATYGPITELEAVRHWPKGVVPGSIELWGQLEGGGKVRLVWHYLPFAPEYSEHLRVLSARKRLHIELFAPSHGDRRTAVSLREKKSGVVQETSSAAGHGAAESMWEGFHAFVVKGRDPISGAASELAQVTLLRRVLAAVVEADGRDIDAPLPQDEDGGDAAETTGAAAATDDTAATDAAEATAATDAAEATEATDAAETTDAPAAEPAGEREQAVAAPDAPTDGPAPAETDGTAEAAAARD